VTGRVRSSGQHLVVPAAARLPAHARHPSAIAQPAIPSATRLWSYQAPHSVLAASPADTAIARQAHSRFCVSSPAVADDPSRAPIRRLTTPRAGSKIAVPPVSTNPIMLVYRRRSDVALASRDPVICARQLSGTVRQHLGCLWVTRCRVRPMGTFAGDV
jgi:hypothetical protein